jgi:prepilin-type N-terminal cleavage/methylation domain-containing protein
VRQEQGFTLVELMMATLIFLVICAAMFELLDLSQRKYSSESQISGAFQETRLAIDQIVRDFNVSGYPARTVFSHLPTDTSKYAVAPLAWQPSYPATQCSIGTGGGGTCATPGDFDVIVETDLGQTSLGTGVTWIRYWLDGTTLYRSVVLKTNGGVPDDAATKGPDVAVPFLTNVMNNAQVALPAQFAQITAVYPSMFPGGVPQPVFKYSCDTATGPQPCPTAGADGIPGNVRDVDITLIVMTRQPDLQTGLPKLVELTGRGHRVNPSN